MEARAWRIRGRVQGVGFRWWTSRVAQRESLVGAVRNERDGSVVVEAWGAPEQLDALERLLRRGPTGARVDALEPMPAPTRSAPGEFTIER